ncbi:MAG TPA: alkaline phosphatase family protein, partial [Vicinamibacterales bacterium]|nr:alkaline phosphatase family protein [Vicinamibacterales bacterium]
DFVGTPMPHGHTLREKGGMLHRFGMDDASTGAMLRDLFAEGTLPEFTVAYFADNDYRSHEVGPHAALDVIERVDRMLGEAFEAGGGIDRVLEKMCVVITSDHGHCDVLADPRRAVIRLDEVLANYRHADLGRAWKGRDQIMICPNMRAAQVYVRHPTPELVERVARDLLGDTRVDQVFFKTALSSESAGYTALSGRGRLQFAQAAGGGRHAADAFGGAWTWSGDAQVLDLQVERGEIEFGQYPNAFERIAGVLELEQSGELWVTAKPGCEFEVPGGKAHVAGASHGALHALDSYSPVIIAGGGTRRMLPPHMRSVDLAPLCMDLLGLRMRYGVGDPRQHVGRPAAHR